MRRPPITARNHRAPFWRVWGRSGAALALIIQILLPAMAMPGDDLGADPAAPIFQAAAAWGRDALCTTKEDEGSASKQLPASHRQCPVCWAQLQMASLLAPVGPALPFFLRRVETQQALVGIAAALQPPYSPSQARAPPLA